MKKIIIYAVFSINFLLAFSQEEKAGIIAKNKSGNISSVEFSAEKDKVPSSATDFFEMYLRTGENDSFKKVPHKSKEAEFTHEHYDQYYKGVKVKNGGYNFHLRNGKMLFANGNYIKIENFDVVPSITQEEALKSFLNYKSIERKTVISTITEFLIKEISKPADSDTMASVELVYRIYLQSDNVNNNEVGFVDAHTGEVTGTEPRLTDLTGTFVTRYSGTQLADTDSDPVNGGFRLFDNTRGAIIHTRNMQNNTTVIANAVELNDNDNNWTATEHTGNKNDMGLDVHWNLQKIYDYLFNTHGINSFNDSGHAINAYVRYGNNNTTRDNAYWDPTLDVLYFGQGISIFRPMASLDIVGHEFGHGITDFQIGWDNSTEQKAFKEGMSDIWGSVFELSIRPNSVWNIGEQVTLTKPYLRNMQNTNDANSLQQTADTYLSAQYNAGTGSDGPYIRGGVFAHWFYVLVNGESGINDLGINYNVYGIGINAAVDLIVEAVFNNYLDNTTTYPSIRTNMVNAANNLFGANSIQSIQVANAWYAVGVGNSPGQFSISGTSPICSYDSTFTVTNLPSVDSIIWITGPSLTIYSGQNTNSPIIKATGSGSSWVRVRLVNDGESITLPQKAVWVGMPDNSQIDMMVMYGQSPGNILCTNTEQIIAASHPNAQQQGIESYYWDFGSWASYHTGYDVGGITNSRPTFYLSGYPPTSQVIKVAAHNQCNHSMTYAKSKTFYAQNCFGLRLVFSPNPATDETTMTIETTSTEESVDRAVEWEMEVYSPAQNLKEKQNKLKGKSTKIQTSGWQEGVYVARVKYKDEILTGKLVVKK